MKLIDLPNNEICDVIMLVNTVDNDVRDMTQKAIDSVHNSELNNKFRIILVESNQNQPKEYNNVFKTIQYYGDFNYNKALNLAFEYIKSDWVCVINNDILAQNNWYSLGRYYADIFELDSFSPWCPVPQNGPNPLAQKIILEYPESSIINGYEPIIHFAGWCWVMKKNVLEKFIPFPEELTFWWQDNYLAQLLKKHNHKHACVTASQIIHFGQQSYKHVDPSKLHGMTNGLMSKYLELLRKMEYNK